MLVIVVVRMVAFVGPTLTCKVATTIIIAIMPTTALGP